MRHRHQDFFQIARNSASQDSQNGVGLTISNNVLYPDGVRVHGVLLNNRYVPQGGAQSSRHRDVAVENNFPKQMHATAGGGR